MNIAIIPARGGSKRIPQKNIKLFYGKPIIAWSIESAKSSNCFDEVIVSTDNAEIADISIKYGAKVPFIRPGFLSDDHTTFRPVVAHCLEWYKSQNYKINMACCIYATAPFILDTDINAGFNAMNISNSNYAISVTEFNYPIQRALRFNENGFAVMQQPENIDLRTQDLDKSYHDAGQFYWGKNNAWLNDVDIFGTKTVPIILPRHRVLDIDTSEDWNHAELLFKILNGK